jgi:hypothetical protein
MGKTNKSLIVLPLAGAVLLFSGCNKDHTDADNTFFSAAVPVGNGSGRSWVTENQNGEPVIVGLTFSEEALENLPHDVTEYVFPLPSGKGKSFYTHVVLDWNPEGHIPEHVYDLPHFDVHFYITSNENRMAIQENDMAEFSNVPSAKYIPESYMREEAGVAQMGTHWVDLTSGEFNGHTFNKTFIWGSYDGRFTFWEPMVTRDYLITKPDEVHQVRQPAAYQQDGYYPTQYKVSYSPDKKEYTVSMDLAFHEGE